MGKSFRHVGKQFSKFLITGSISTAVNLGFVALLVQILHLNYLFGSGAGYIIGLVVGYFLNRAWTFQRRAEPHHAKEMVQYILVYLTSFALYLVTVRLLVRGLDISVIPANVFAVGVSMITNFLGLKLIVFRSTSHH